MVSHLGQLSTVCGSNILTALRAYSLHYVDASSYITRWLWN